MLRNLITQSVETKLNFIVFILFSVLMTTTIYNSVLESQIVTDIYTDGPSVNIRHFRSAHNSTTTNTNPSSSDYGHPVSN